MNRVPLWLIFVMLFVVFFALYALGPSPVVADELPQATAWQHFIVWLQYSALPQALVALVASAFATALFALVRWLYGRWGNRTP